MAQQKSWQRQLRCQHTTMLKNLASIGLVSACFLTAGCYFDRDNLLPGLMIGEDGRLLKADPEHKRQVQERVLNQELNRLCGDGWFLRGILLALPRYEPQDYPEHPWRWDELALRIQLIGRKDPLATTQPPAEAAILQACQDLFGPTGAQVSIMLERSQLPQENFARMRSAILSSQ